LGDTLRSIIVNADDFGRHILINKAVAQAVKSGFLRSATVMPGGKAFDSAVKIAKTHDTLGVGIHFTLVNGFPILPPTQIPSLVNDDGVFFDDYGQFMKRYLRGRIVMEEVRLELAAQLAKVQNAGIEPTHADSHQHLHHLPGISDIVLDLAAVAGIKRLRVARPKINVGIRGRARNFPKLGQLVGRFGLGALAAVLARKAKRKGFSCPDHFAGIVAGEAVSEIYMRQIVLDMAEGVTEVMLHPGLNNKILARECAWAHDFEAEYQAATSPALMELLKEKKIFATNFRLLGC